MRTPRHYEVVTLGLVFAAVGCGTKRKVDDALDNANKLMLEYQRLGRNLDETITSLRASATTAANAAPAKLANVPPIAAKATGDVDVTAERAGKQGTAKANVDGVGQDEDVTAFVPDASQGDAEQQRELDGKDFTSGGDAAVFAAWRGDAESEDEGVCYLAWENRGTAWLLSSKCGETKGGYVCKVTEQSAECSACNVAGDCASCDMDDEDFRCEWPE
jgi:hypothetical protein